MQASIPLARKMADISRHHLWFSREMTSEGQTQNFHTDDVSLPGSGKCFQLVEANFPRGATEQKHYPDVGSDTENIFCLKFLQSFLRRYFTEKPVVTSSNVGCFLRLTKPRSSRFSALFRTHALTLCHPMAARICDQGPVSRKARKLFGPEGKF